MRAPTAIAIAMSAFTMGPLLIACFDLFHSTDDVLPLCLLDAGAPGCQGSLDAAADATPAADFCAWDRETARGHARHACAWLGACQSPLGRNAFGECMVQALLAYDCAANPHHRSKGEARRLW